MAQTMATIIVREMVPKLVYSPADAAEMLSICRSEVYELIAQGEIESYKHGKARRIPHASLVAYVERKTAEVRS